MHSGTTTCGSGRTIDQRPGRTTIKPCALLIADWRVVAESGLVRGAVRGEDEEEIVLCTAWHTDESLQAVGKPRR
eukprot:SAG11_NODE_512_length_8839_cov_5.600572_4_plen_75_part_00